MKRQIEKDERVLAQKRKIGSDAFQILLLGLPLSIIVQQYVFNAPFAQYAVEFVLFAAASIYVIIRNIMVGNELFTSNKNSNALVYVCSLVCGLTVTITNTVINYQTYGKPLDLGSSHIAAVAIITFLSATATAFIPLKILNITSQKRQKKLEEELNRNETDE